MLINNWVRAALFQAAGSFVNFCVLVNKNKSCIRVKRQELKAFMTFISMSNLSALQKISTGS